LLCDTSGMTTPTVPSLLPHLWKSAAVSGLLAIVLGVAIVAWPGISIAIAAIFFGAGLLLTGIQQVFFAFTLDASAGGRVLLFISGAASLILAIMAFRHRYDAVLLLAIWIGVGFIFRGVATTVSAISDPTLPGRGWNVFVGAISLVAGVVVLASPFDSIGTLAFVVGIWLIVIGVMEVVSAVAIRRTTQQVHGSPVPEATAPTPEPEKSEKSEEASN
jgi:uncharacterized membrane protein HdeD (DUF308 family)